jgi:hypothetical protein
VARDALLQKKKKKFFEQIDATLSPPRWAFLRGQITPVLVSPKTDEEKKIAEVVRARMAADAVRRLRVVTLATELGEKDLLSLAIITGDPPPDSDQAGEH